MDEGKFYDDKWMAWRDMQRYAPAPRYLRRVVMKELSRLTFDSVLDAGCGQGTLLEMLARRYPSVQLSGSELSETALEACRRQLPNATIYGMDLLKDDVLDEHRCDVVISVQVLEHIEDDLLALRKLRQLCRRHVLVSVPGGKLDAHGQRNGHYRHYTKQSLCAVMRTAGFDVTRTFSCGWPVHSLVYRYAVRALPSSVVAHAGLGGTRPPSVPQ
jgi:2-polyprenyl-3-methyl-5-hydroxy-6-metoxy-1,4-benzoquinol methylase